MSTEDESGKRRWKAPIDARTPDGGLAMFTKPLDLGTLLDVVEQHATRLAG